MPTEPDLLLTLTLFREGEKAPLCAPAMIKTKPSHTIERIGMCASRWVKVPIAHLMFNNQPLDAAATVVTAGLGMQSAVIGVLARDAPAPEAAACAMPFAMLDVLDSEMAAAADSLGVSS